MKIKVNSTVRWSDPNGQPLTGVVVGINAEAAIVVTQHQQELIVPISALTPMASRLNIQPDSTRWQ